MSREETRVELEIRDGSEIVEQLTAKIESYGAVFRPGRMS